MRRAVRPCGMGCGPAAHAASLRHQGSRATATVGRRRSPATNRAPIRALTRRGVVERRQPRGHGDGAVLGPEQRLERRPLGVLVEHPAYARQVVGGGEPGEADALGEVVVVGLERQVDPAVEARDQTPCSARSSSSSSANPGRQSAGSGRPASSRATTSRSEAVWVWTRSHEGVALASIC